MKKKSHKYRSKIKKPKIYYADTNILVHTNYVVIDKKYALCTSIAHKGIESCLSSYTNKFDFPNDLGYHPHIELINELNEPECNIYIYKITFDFENNEDIVADEDYETDFGINDDVICVINERLFTIGEDEIYPNEDDLSFMNEQF